MNNTHAGGSDNVVATINNQENPAQNIDILYWREKNGFITSGIQTYFAEKEILIPTHLVALDIQLIGAIISVILEDLSRAAEGDGRFTYMPQFDVLDRTYRIIEEEDYVRLERP